MYHKLLNKPTVPEHLILPLDKILQIENIFGGETSNYTLHECQSELKEYLKIIFPEYTKFRYQTLKKTIPVHKDRGRIRAVNYIIDAGGSNVKTVWYEEDYTTPVYSVILPVKQWHELEVDTYHTVENIETRRYAITVT
jgi:hypothetical protein